MIEEKISKNRVNTGEETTQSHGAAAPLLLLEDEKNYTDDMPVMEFYAAKGIICRDGKYVMQLGDNGERKIPGGGVEEGEDYVDALCREVAEETGLVVDRSSVRLWGEILEIRRDIYDGDKKYIKHSMVYFCDVEEGRVEMKMTESEISRGFHPVWESLETIISENRKNIREEWRLRDTRLLELLRNKVTVQPSHS